jgi:4'-phosphopantetheinyl transferase
MDNTAPIETRHSLATGQKVEQPPESAAANPCISWLGPPAQWSLAKGEVHVWAAPLNAATEKLKSLTSLLAADEAARAERYRFDRDRERFVVGRGLLRIILGRYLGLSPAEIRFAYSPNGKPLLPDLDFNLSHCEDLALVAVSRGSRVGVDVERVRVLKDAAELVARFFSPGEHAAYEKLPPADQPQAFFNLWTRKEAWLKATGDGIGHLLNQVEVSFCPGEPACFVRLPGDAHEGKRWRLHELTPAVGFAAALVHECNHADIAPAGEKSAAGETRFQCWRWTDI